MGWTCQHDHNGYCKLLKKDCHPGMKGCTLKKTDGIIFTTGNFEDDKKLQDMDKEKGVDFAALARSN